MIDAMREEPEEQEDPEEGPDPAEYIAIPDLSSFYAAAFKPLRKG